MNVLYVIASYGTENLAGIVHTELAHEFVKHGHSFSVFSLTTARESAGRPLDTVQDQIPIHRVIASGKQPEDVINRATLPIFQYSRFVTTRYLFDRFLSQHREFDVVLVEGAYPFGAIVAPACVKRRVPFVVSVAGGDFIASQSAEYGYGRYRVARRYLRQVFRDAAVIRVTTPLVSQYARQYGGLPEKIGIAPANLAAYSFLAPAENVPAFRHQSRSQILAHLNPETGPLLLTSGRLLPIKGFDLALRAMPDILSKFPAATLLIVGPDRATRAGSYQKQLQDLASSLGISNSIHFVGAVDHPAMKTWLAAADVVLVPSILEGMNRTAVEAAAVGTPVVVTLTAGIAEQAAAAGAGISIESENPQALSTAALRILQDPALAARMSAAGPGFAAQFSSEHIGALLIQLCERALSPASAQT